MKAFAPGDRCRLNCPTAQAYNGKFCTVVRPLVLGAEVDASVGPMFRVYVDSPNGGPSSFDAFAEELEPIQ